MKLRVEHTTTFAYEAPITEGYTEIRLKPLDSGGQRCVSFSLETEPSARVHRYRDRFGNDVRHFDMLAPHEQLVVHARSEVVTPETLREDETVISPLDLFDYLSPSPRAPFTEAIRALATPCHVEGDRRATAERVIAAVRERLSYETGTTDVGTTADEALEQGRGVCQDFAHLALAACRLNHLPARYVSGYVHAPGKALGAASHAWIDVFVEGQGWISLDPTHDGSQTPGHVRVAVGRDYGDVSPTKGVYKGTAVEKLEVVVRVEVR